MAAKQNILGLVNPGRQIRRPPLVGVKFLHEQSMGTTDLVGVNTRLKPKDLIGLLLSHWPAAWRRPAVPRCRVSVRVFTPAGIPAVKISCQ